MQMKEDYAEQGGFQSLAAYHHDAREVRMYMCFKLLLLEIIFSHFVQCSSMCVLLKFLYI